MRDALDSSEVVALSEGEIAATSHFVLFALHVSHIARYYSVLIPLAAHHDRVI